MFLSSCALLFKKIQPLTVAFSVLMNNAAPPDEVIVLSENMDSRTDRLLSLLSTIFSALFDVNVHCEIVF